MKTIIAVLFFSFLAIDTFSQQLESFEENGKYGIKESVSGKVTVPAKYDEIYTFLKDLPL
jgi:hypothetical protein